MQDHAIAMHGISLAFHVNMLLLALATRGKIQRTMLMMSLRNGHT